MQKKLTTLLLASTLVAIPGLGIAKSNIEQSGDLVQYLLPTLALGTSYYLEDETGQSQFYRSFFANVLITHGLKNLTNKERPNGANRESFPSGHTSASFQAASFIHVRYGIGYAIPAYAAATFVGYSRVESKNHFTEDVVAGAIIGTISSFYYTSPYKNLLIAPQISADKFSIYGQLKW